MNWANAILLGLLWVAGGVVLIEIVRDARR
jgi:hypothetical protein